METKKILVPTDFSEAAFRALEHAAALAEETGADIHLVHVIHYSALSMMRAPEINMIVPSSFTFFLESKKQQMESIKRWVLQKYTVNIITAMPEGNTVQQLTDYATTYAVDLIILHDTEKPGFWSRLFGDKAKHIQRKVSMPVITILDSSEKPFDWSNVVIPVTDSVPEARIRTIASFAEKFKITVHFVALKAWGTAKRPLAVLLQSLQAIRSKCNTPVICKELKGKHLHEAARNYAEKIHANALIENNAQPSNTGGLIARITQYFEKTEYPYMTPGMI